MYKIVETIEEGEKLLTVIPSCWEKDGILSWPTNCKNVDSLRKKCIVPAPNWSKEKCILKREDIKSFSKFTSLLHFKIYVDHKSIKLCCT